MAGWKLRSYESQSTPGQLYDVILGSDSRIYCTCRGWKNNRHCKHLDMYMEELKKAASLFELKPKVLLNPKENAMRDILEQVIAELRGRCASQNV